MSFWDWLGVAVVLLFIDHYIVNICRTWEKVRK